MEFTDVEQNIQAFLRRVRTAAAGCGRRAEGIRCVAVTKGHPPSYVMAAVSAGMCDIGENRVQEAVAKIEELSVLNVCWHLVGSLQTNKVRTAVRSFSMIQSVDRENLAREIQRECERQNKIMDILLQVDATDEPSKHGVKPDRICALLASVRNLDRLRVRGIMTIGPFTDDQTKVRNCFHTVRSLFETLRVSADATFDILSMGMSDDFEIAVAEGSTMLRVGTVLFGPRHIR